MLFSGIELGREPLDTTMPAAESGHQKKKTLKHRASFLKSTLYYYVTMYYHPVP